MPTDAGDARLLLRVSPDEYVTNGPVWSSWPRRVVIGRWLGSCNRSSILISTPDLADGTLREPPADSWGDRTTRIQPR
jgi:hypothetical protein